MLISFKLQPKIKRIYSRSLLTKKASRQNAVIAVNTSLVLLSLSFLNNEVLACALFLETPKPDCPWVSTFSGGVVWTREHSTQTLYITPDIEKIYTPNQITNELFYGEIFVGLKKRLSPILQGQLGLALAVASDTTLSGYVGDDADTEFNNHTYRYKIHHNHLAIKTKLLANRGYGLLPWVSGGIGLGFNHAHAYINTPLFFEALATPNFTSHSQTTFSYTLGAGVQKSLTSHWQIGIGYEFSDWGKSQLGRAVAQTTPSGLTLNHLYTNGVLCNLTYLA